MGSHSESFVHFHPRGSACSAFSKRKTMTFFADLPLCPPLQRDSLFVKNAQLEQHLDEADGQLQRLRRVAAAPPPSSAAAPQPQLAGRQASAPGPLVGLGSQPAACRECDSLRRQLETARRQVAPAGPLPGSRLPGLGLNLLHNVCVAHHVTSYLDCAPFLLHALLMVQRASYNIAVQCCCC